MACRRVVSSAATWEKKWRLRSRNRDYGRRDPQCCPRDTPLSAKVRTNFVDKWRSIGRYNSLADYNHETIFIIIMIMIIIISSSGSNIVPELVHPSQERRCSEMSCFYNIEH
jgi:hypothetical protein